METIENILKYLDTIESYSASVWITLCCSALGFICIKLIYSAQSQSKRPKWAFPGLIFSVIIIITAQGIRWWYMQAQPVITPKESFHSLVENKRVQWLIRLIPYSSINENHLSIHELKLLGPPHTEFVFVADYDELKNNLVIDAVYKSGLPFTDKDSVSAIIFPLKHKKLYPANARGILQVIKNVDAKKSGTNGYVPFELSNFIEPTPLSALFNDSDLTSWSWIKYSGHYIAYKNAVEIAKEQNISALKFIGRLEKDWHPLGYSKNQNQDINESKQCNFSLKTKDGFVEDAPNFGVRVFLISNMKLKDIGNVVLIHFDTPDNDRIPDLGGRSGRLLPF